MSKLLLKAKSLSFSGVPPILSFFTTMVPGSMMANVMKGVSGQPIMASQASSTVPRNENLPSAMTVLSIGPFSQSASFKLNM